MDYDKCVQERKIASEPTLRKFSIKNNDDGDDGCG